MDFYEELYLIRQELDDIVEQLRQIKKQINPHYPFKKKWKKSHSSAMSATAFRK